MVFNARDGHPDLPIKIPCGRCKGCRLERSRQWATRCVHEAQMHSSNEYLTLTYSDEHLPSDYSVNVRDYQLFMKRVRKRFGPVRFFHCGEYGDLNRRPHYHALLFGMEFKDREPYGQNANGDILYSSPILTELWGKGHCTLGDVTFQSAAYVARYVMKKRTGDESTVHYTIPHPYTGEIVTQRPEYVTMSRNPGIGTGWYQKFKTDVYPSDFIVLNGVRVRPPRWYDTIMEKSDPKLFREMKMRRKVNAKRNAHDNTSRRLRVKELVMEDRLKRLKRSL